MGKEKNHDQDDINKNKRRKKNPAVTPSKNLKKLIGTSDSKQLKAIMDIVEEEDDEEEIRFESYYWDLMTLFKYKIPQYLQQQQQEQKPN